MSQVKTARWRGERHTERDKEKERNKEGEKERGRGREMYTFEYR